MSQVNLKVQVYCVKPSWVNFEKNRYRLYVDEDMLTERSWIWDIKTYIDENIWVELQADTEHIIKLVPILDPIDSFAKFALKKLRVNGKLLYFTNQDQSELSFRI